MRKKKLRLFTVLERVVLVAPNAEFLVVSLTVAKVLNGAFDEGIEIVLARSIVFVVADFLSFLSGSS